MVREVIRRMSPILTHKIPTVTVDYVPKYRKVDYIVSGYRGYPQEKEDVDDILVNKTSEKSKEKTKSHKDHNCEESYRYPVSWCFRSLFTLHNETINIWTHLIGGFFFLILGYNGVHDLFVQYQVNTGKISEMDAHMNTDLHFDIPSSSGRFMVDQVVYLIYVICSSCAFFGSSLFHWFNPVSKSCHFQLRVLDFAGIAFLCCGSQWPLMYYAFYCEKTATALYTGLLLFLTIFGFVFPFFPMFHMVKYRSLRITIYVAMSALPLVMYAHIVGTYGFYHESSYLFGFLGITYLVYVLGLVFYVTRFPERLWPGKFDIWLSSHQLWHCIACIGAYVWYYGFTSYMHVRLQTPCLISE